MSNEQIKGSLPGRSRRVLDPVNILMANAKPLLICGILVLLMLLPLVYVKKSSTYSVTGRLRIDPVIPTQLNTTEELSITGYYHDYLRTEVQALSDSLLLRQAIESLPSEVLVKTGWELDSWSSLERRLTIKQVGGTQLLEVGIYGMSPHGLDDLVNALMGAYLKRAENKEETKDTRRIAYLNDVRDELKDREVHVMDVLGTLSANIRTSTYEQGYWSRRESLAEMQKALARSKDSRIQAESSLDRTLTEIKDLGALDRTAVVNDLLSRDDSLWNTEFWTYRQMQNLRSSIDGITAENPDGIYVDRRLEEMSNYMDKIRNRTENKTTLLVKQLHELKVQEREIEARGSLREAKQIESQLEVASLVLEEEAGWAARKMVEAKSLETELENLRSLSFRVDERLHELKLDSKAPARVSIEFPAEFSEEPSGSNFKKLLIMALALSFGSVGGVIFLKDALNDRIRRPIDIEMATGAMPSWPISHLEAPTGSFENLVLSGSSHQAARAIRSLAFRLMRIRSEEALVTTFTGVDRGVGNTGILLNVAQALRSSGVSTVVVDLNPLSHQLRELMLKAEGEPTEFMGFLKGRDEERQLDLYYPDMELSGNLPALEPLLKKLRHEVGIVLIDTAPVLASEWTEVAAGWSNACVLTTQGDVTRYPILRRSFEILWRLGVPHLLTSLNWGGQLSKAD